MEYAGTVLAGGKNSRMYGKDKSFITIGNDTIVQRTVNLLKEIFDEIIIVTNAPEKYAMYKEKRCIIVPDIIKDKRPLGGIHSALSVTSKDGVFCFACDMPFLHIGLIRRLLELAKGSDSECIVPCSDTKVEPLHAAYSKTIFRRLEAALQGEELEVKEFLKQCDCKYIATEPDELISFFNINTPKDLKEYENKIKDMA